VASKQKLEVRRPGNKVRSSNFSMSSWDDSYEVILHKVAQKWSSLDTSKCSQPEPQYIFMLYMIACGEERYSGCAVTKRKKKM